MQRKRYKGRGKARARVKQNALTGSFEGKVEHLAHRGDGVVAIGDQSVYVPFTIPGEQVRFSVKKGRVHLDEILESSPQRQEPVCKHFGICGGCDLQHLKQEAYLNWKQDQVARALSQRGVEGYELRPLKIIDRDTRRRATFAVQKSGASLEFGYFQRASGTIVELEECCVLDPDLVEALPALRELSDYLLPTRGHLAMSVTKSESGLDIDIRGDCGFGDDLNLEQREHLSALAETHDWGRLSLEGEPFLVRRAPIFNFSGVTITPPPSAFLQASPQSEAILQALVLEGVGQARMVADLFAGCGTFTFALAKTAQLLAVEGDEKALQSLSAGAAHAEGVKKITSLHRDLAIAPLVPSELGKFEAVVFDPPRNGAKEQAEALADSEVPVVVGVSCAPATFARDAKILCEGGYQLESVAPVDQFLWSHHIELVGLFRRV